MSLPVMPRSAQSARARAMTSSMSSRAISCSAGTGLAIEMPLPRPRSNWALTMRAASSGVSTRIGTGMPEEREKKEGKSSVP